MSEHLFSLADSDATVALGRAIALAEPAGAVIYLHGPLGAGKTTLSRGILQGLGHQGAVKSPTYTLVEPYEFPQLHVYHFDLYRLGDPEELEFMGIRDYFTEHSLSIVEWPECGEGWLPAADIECFLDYHQHQRTARMVAHSEFGQQLLQKIAQNHSAGSA